MKIKQCWRSGLHPTTGPIFHHLSCTAPGWVSPMAHPGASGCSLPASRFELFLSRYARLPYDLPTCTRVSNAVRAADGEFNARTSIACSGSGDGPGRPLNVGCGSAHVFPQRVRRRSDSGYCIPKLRLCAAEFLAPVPDVVDVVDVHPCAMPRAP